MLRLDACVSKERAYALIRLSLDMVPKKAIANLSQGCITEMMQVLEG